MLVLLTRPKGKGEKGLLKWCVVVLSQHGLPFPVPVLNPLILYRPVGFTSVRFFSTCLDIIMLIGLAYLYSQPFTK